MCNGNLIGAGVLAGGGVLVFGSMVAYLSVENMGYPGWTGPASLAVTAGSVGGLIIANRVVINRAQRRAADKAYRDWMEFRDGFPVELHYALDILHDPFQALMLWTHPQVGVGLAPNPMFAGTYPRLKPGQDPGHKPDDGMRETPVGLRVRLEMPHGFSGDHIRRALPNLASSLHVPKVQVVAELGEVVSIELRVRNPLADTVPFPGPEPSPVPLKALRVAMRENGDPYRLRIWNNHLFLAGVTGSGKSGVLWSIIGALAPDIKTGRVQLHVIDLKRGGEMAAGYRLYATWAYLVSDAIATLETLVRIMRARLDERREHAMRTGEPIRNHEATVDDPHHVLLIDEFIALIALVGDAKGFFDVPQIDGTYKRENIKVSKYIEILLLELLSQARSVGITVLAATQNAAKSIFEVLRDMFSVVIGLRQASAQQMQMTYGTGAAERGVDATAITVDEAGTAFVDSPEAGGQAQRIRFFRVEDIDIMKLVEIFGRGVDELPPTVPKPAVVVVEPTDSNVYELPHRPTDEEQQPPVPLAQLVDDAPNQCKWCGKEIEQVPGGRRAEYCPGTDHRQRYHRALKKRQAQGGT
ncbi:FtsK/SpoIIIE domain-containing protein [Nocardia brasiliensis]|uniref:FtsK/SpoIIIE domain-containing protein n=1 Tax=Nocardia brasiliensis TaxID=37326 RepID=UPI002457C38C|nr:FtsK/SpoIIIE domain-containing protein [Nocardia brasiliensis]